jgi:hypothetical protein
MGGDHRIKGGIGRLGARIAVEFHESKGDFLQAIPSNRINENLLAAAGRTEDGHDVIESAFLEAKVCEQTGHSVF